MSFRRPLLATLAELHILRRLADRLRSRWFGEIRTSAWLDPHAEPLLLEGVLYMHPRVYQAMIEELRARELDLDRWADDGGPTP